MARINRRTIQKRDLHDPDNHNGVIINLEPDILKCKVKWDLGSITMNKASGSDGLPYELFKILEEDAVKVLGWLARFEGGSRARGHMYTYSWFMLMYGRIQHNIVKQFSAN